MHDADTGKWCLCRKKPPAFMCNPLARQMCRLRRHRANGCQCLIINAGLPKTRQKPAITQHPQGIFGDSCFCIPDKTQTSSGQISQPAKRILKRAVSSDIKGIDREIAAARIFRPVIGKADHGMPTIGVQINPCLRQLYRLAIRNHGDRPMHKTCFNDLQTGIPQGINSPRNRTGDGHIDITRPGMRRWWPVTLRQSARARVQHPVAHGTANNACLAIQRLCNIKNTARQRRHWKPGNAGPTRHRHCHQNRPARSCHP